MLSKTIIKLGLISSFVLLISCGGSGGDSPPPGDTTAPDKPAITYPYTSMTINTSQLTLSGFAEDGSQVEVFSGSNSLGSTTASGGAWQLDNVSFADGVHVLTAYATDAAGNVSPVSDIATLTVDTQAPALPIVSSPVHQSVTSSDTFALTGTADIDAYIYIKEGATTLAILNPPRVDENWNTADLVFTEGLHQLTLWAEDSAGNASAVVNVDVTVDQTLPVVDAGSDKIVNSSVLQDATATDQTAMFYQWTQQSGPGTVSFSNSQQEDTSLSADTDGVYVLRLTVTDAAGNSNFAETSFTWDTQPPTVLSQLPAANSISVDVNNSVRAVFSEPVIAISSSTEFDVSDSSVSVVGSVMTQGNNVAVFTPDTTLAFSTLYTATLTTAITDLAGNPLASAVSWDFTTAASTAPQVEALYSVNGINWNDYVLNDGVETFSSSDTACLYAYDSPVYYNACLNGGEYRVIDLPAYTVCGDIAATDSLSAFNWICDDSTGSVRIISAGFKEGKHLSDLVDFDAVDWLENSVTISGSDIGLPVSTSVSRNWYGNPVYSVESDTVTDVPAAVYLVRDNLNGRYELAADKIAFIIKPGSTLSAATPGPNVIYANNRKFIWIEGNVDATGSDRGVELYMSRFSMLRDLSASAGVYSGIYLNGADSNRLMNSAAENSYMGAHIYNSDYNQFQQLHVSNNSTNGIALLGSKYNHLTNIIAANNNGNFDNAGIGLLENADGNLLTDSVATHSVDGVKIRGRGNRLQNVNASNNFINGFYVFGADNTLTNITASSNGDNGVIIFYNSYNNRLSNLTLTNNNFSGLYMWATTHNVVMNLNAASNSYGIYLYAPETEFNTFNNLALAHNAFGIVAHTGTTNLFTGEFKVGNNQTDCAYNTLSMAPSAVTCLTGQVSNATIISAISLSSSYIGQINSDDVINQDDSNGTATYPTDPDNFDWTGFENSFRNWGIDGTGFIDFGYKGDWYGSTHTGRIWDWTLSTADSDVIRNALTMSTNGNLANTREHVWPAVTTNQAGCDAQAPGSIFYAVDDCRSVFLQNATEIVNDDIGNDNGLCESNEHCLFTPNIASYQGEGSVTISGPLTGNTLSGILLHTYPTNGQ